MLTLPAIIPVRNAADEQLAVAARASVPLQAARRLADWFGDQPVDAELGWRSASAQRDAAMAVAWSRPASPSPARPSAGCTGFSRSPSTRATCT
jgi:hypothetical protein